MEKTTDPVCGMEVGETEFTSQHMEHTFHFCCSGCKEEFDRNPVKYMKNQETDLTHKLGIHDSY